MSEAQLPVESYLENVREALGAYKGIDFRQLCSIDKSIKGKGWVKSFRPKLIWDNAKGAYIEQTPKDVDLDTWIDRRMWEADEDLQTFANDVKRRTPHQDIDFYMSEVAPKVVHTGHEFETLDEVFESNDPTSPTIKTLVNSFQTKRNLRVLDAVMAATVNRKKLCLVKGNQNFGKVITGAETWANTAPHNTLTTTNVGYFSFKDDAPLVRAMADCANIPDKEKLIMLINPNDAAQTCIRSFDKMYSIDFVEKRHLDAGTLPEAFGISFLKSTLVPKGKMVAWLKEAISFCPWVQLEMALARNISNCNRPEFYARESNNLVRIDDLGVFVINVKTEG